MGLIGAPLCYGLVVIKNKLGMDEKPNQSDYPDAFGVHSVGGIVGGILVVRHLLLLSSRMRKTVADCTIGVQGFFANPEIAGVAGVFYKLPGDKYTNGEQLGWQLAGICITIGYTAVVSAILVRQHYVMGVNDCLFSMCFRDCLRASVR